MNAGFENHKELYFFLIFNFFFSGEKKYDEGRNLAVEYKSVLLLITRKRLY